MEISLRDVFVFVVTSVSKSMLSIFAFSHNGTPVFASICVNLPSAAHEMHTATGCAIYVKCRQKWSLSVPSALRMVGKKTIDEANSQMTLEIAVLSLY